MSYGLVGSSEPAGACSVITEDGEQGFPRPGLYFSVYAVIVYNVCL